MACPKNWIDVAQGLLTPAIAAAVGFLAYLQWWLARAVHRREMFGRRFAVYQAAAAFVSSTLQSDEPSNERDIKFLEATQGALFLFGRSGENIAGYLDELWKKCGDYVILCRLITQQAPGGADQTQSVQAQRAISAWLFEQSKSGLVSKFKPHLGSPDTPPWLSKLFGG